MTIRDLLASGDEPVGLPCPAKRCDGEIVYNGNYFCSRWGDTCYWALSHNARNGDPIGKRDKETWQEIQQTEWFKGLRR